MKAFLTALLLATGAQAAPLSATEPAQDRSPVRADAIRGALDRTVPAWLADYDVPSAAIAYIENGRIAFVAVYGERAPGIAANTDTLYNIASMAKPIVAETILSLAAAGRLSLDDRMADWWTDPDIADDPRRLLLTPRLALSHRTGFPNWRYETDGKLIFRSDPGARFGYSGEGFQYLARYAERRIGQGFEDIVEQQVFAPAGMRSTAFTRRDWFADRVAVPQGPDGSRRAPTIRDTWNAADDVYATAGDYARFLIWAFADGRLPPDLDHERLAITEDQAQRLCASGRLPEGTCPAALGFGLGWTIYDTGRERIVMHGGGDWGEHTLAFYVPERQSGAIIFTNGANGQKLIRDVVEAIEPDPSFVAFMAMQAGG